MMIRDNPQWFASGDATDRKSTVLSHTKLAFPAMRRQAWRYARQWDNKLLSLSITNESY